MRSHFLRLWSNGRFVAIPSGAGTARRTAFLRTTGCFLLFRLGLPNTVCRCRTFGRLPATRLSAFAPSAPCPTGTSNRAADTFAATRMALRPPVHYPFLDALLSLLGSAGESGWLAQLETMAPSMDTSALPASFSCGSYGRRSTKWRPVCRAWSPARLDPSRDSGSILEGREALRLWSESPRPTHATEVDAPCRSEA